MSTRTQIAFDNTSCKVYKHHDGYPSDVLEALLPFVDDFMKRRGYDPDYMVAQLCCTLINRAHENHCQWKKEINQPEPQRDLTGYGVDCQWHGDIEYLYIVRSLGVVDVYTTHGDDHCLLNHHGDEISCRHLGRFPLGTDVAEAIEACEKAEGRA